MCLLKNQWIVSYRIDFHTLAGFDDIKIGSWFMDYNDFKEEMKAYEKKYKENLSAN